MKKIDTVLDVISESMNEKLVDIVNNVLDKVNFRTKVNSVSSLVEEFRQELHIVGLELLNESGEKFVMPYEPTEDGSLLVKVGYLSPETVKMATPIELEIFWTMENQDEKTVEIDFYREFEDEEPDGEMGEMGHKMMQDGTLDEDVSIVDKFLRKFENT